MNTPQPEPRLFHLVRPACAAPVAEGVEWSDRTVTLRWRGQWPATSVWEGGVAAVLEVHGRNGATELRWLPATPPSPRTPAEPAPPATGTPAGSAAPPVAGTATEPPASVAGATDWQALSGLRLAAPGLDGRCVSCGRVWPCLSCGP
ncbi:hypothetical protein AB0P21_23390 [Kribbella sp. NPDC056861]|uniref:hypothetical protein n=1 Tax=Kribbella sp. NPDC056861 TaxID=3154857 RepID=UPI00343385D4